MWPSATSVWSLKLPVWMHYNHIYFITIQCRSISIVLQIILRFEMWDNLQGVYIKWFLEGIGHEAKHSCKKVRSLSTLPDALREMLGYEYYIRVYATYYGCIMRRACTYMTHCICVKCWAMNIIDAYMRVIMAHIRIYNTHYIFVLLCVVRLRISWKLVFMRRIYS